MIKLSRIMKNQFLFNHIRAVFVVALAASTASAQVVVEAPGVEILQGQNNIFDQLKYAWEQTQWADKLATLHNTLTTVQEQLQTVNQVRQAIGNPAAASGLINNSTLSGFLKDSGIPDTLSDLSDITRQGEKLSAAIPALFKPIKISDWTNRSVTSFNGVSAFRDPSDPLKQYRAVENAYSRFETVLTQASAKRKILNEQVAQLNTQLKGAKDDAEVQKVTGSLQTAQTALNDLDSMVASARNQVQLVHLLNQNRKEEEEAAAEEISRQRNRESARTSAEAEAALDGIEKPTLPPGF